MPSSLSKPMSSPRDLDRKLNASCIILSEPAEARRLQEEVEQLLRARRVHDHDIFSIRLALEEALVNAIKHGNQMDRTKKVQVSYQLQPDGFEVHIVDEGDGFDPADVPDPTAIENLERPCGRGLMLMRYYMTEVAFNDRGNSVRMRKLFRPSSNGKKP